MDCIISLGLSYFYTVFAAKGINHVISLCSKPLNLYAG
ncbi:hypothetical protein PTET_a2380 [Pseudoalteromonas tetraodonis]|nr:hypothetical protein PTET_a2380 [Pseudoalteromonas tetraodonis]